MRNYLCALLLATGCDSSTPDDPNNGDNPGSPDAATSTTDAALAVDCNLDPTLSFDDLGETLQIATADGKNCAIFSRRNDCGPDTICKAIPFSLLEARIAHDGQIYEQSDSAQMHWEGTWHNWTDWADVRIDDTCLHLQVIFGDPFQYDIDARNCDTAAVLWTMQLSPYPAP